MKSYTSDSIKIKVVSHVELRKALKYIILILSRILLKEV